MKKDRRILDHFDIKKFDHKLKRINNEYQSITQPQLNFYHCHTDCGSYSGLAVQIQSQVVALPVLAELDG